MRDLLSSSRRGNHMSGKKSHVLNVFMNRDYRSIVKDKETKECLDPALHFSVQLALETLSRGLCIQFSIGNDRGQAADMMFLGSPFITTRNQIDDLIAILDESLTTVEKKT